MDVELMERIADYQQECLRQEGEIERLQAENEALRKDAARYRWLREAPWSREMQRMFALQANAMFDEAIDSAMKEKP